MSTSGELRVRVKRRPTVSTWPAFLLHLEGPETVSAANRATRPGLDPNPIFPDGKEGGRCPTGGHRSEEKEDQWGPPALTRRSGGLARPMEARLRKREGTCQPESFPEHPDYICPLAQRDTLGILPAKIYRVIYAVYIYVPRSLPTPASSIHPIPSPLPGPLQRRLPSWDSSV